MRQILLVAAVAAATAGCASTGTGTSPVLGNTPTRVMAPVTAASVDITVNPNVATQRAAVSAPSARTYAALRAAFAEMGIAVTQADSAAFSLGNPRLQASRRLGSEPLSTYFDCGRTQSGAPTANSYRLLIGLNSSVVAAGTGSELLTTVTASAHNPAGSAGDPVVCHSTGQLEEHIARMVRERLQS